MTNNTGLLPEGISHTPDLSGLSRAERLEHHRRQLQTIAFHEGVNGAASYRSQYPEAHGVLVHNSPRAYIPKPRGYAAYLATMVDRWFDSNIALEQTNKADVERLNDALGCTFDPDKHFSRALTPANLRRLCEVCAKRGLHIDPAQVDTLCEYIAGQVRVAMAQGR